MKQGRGRPPKLSDDDIRELHADGCTNIEMAEILGVSQRAIAIHLEKMGLERNPTRVRFRKQYIVHDRESGEFVAKGTMDEISAQLNISEKTLFHHASALRNNYYPLPRLLIREVEHG